MKAPNDPKPAAPASAFERARAQFGQAAENGRLAKVEHERVQGNRAKAEALAAKLKDDITEQEAGETADALVLSTAPDDEEAQGRVQARIRKLLELRATLQAVETVTLPAARSAEEAAWTDRLEREQQATEAYERLASAAFYDKYLQVKAITADLTPHIDELTVLWGKIGRTSLQKLHARDLPLQYLIFRSFPVEIRKLNKTWANYEAAPAPVGYFGQPQLKLPEIAESLRAILGLSE